ncbi:MAG: sigma-70 family RNA polymerase sigma factor [Prevotellaceae bacterium]|jgi:RNA polymerase sigma-70 factor (ECF subfamily)|nr:sigma-70 family RNA polymerase sigma factor [Prevotellaceae bacterium]
MNNYEEIINGLRKSDERLQMRFYDMFATTTFQSAFAILGNSHEAEEIMQDTILKALTKISLINDDENQMRKTLRRIAINASIDMLRKRKNYLEINEKDIDYIDDNDGEEIKFTIAHIKKGIQSLATGYRAIVSLHLFENMNFEQISAQLKISPHTVRSQYSRALLKLRKYLKNNTNE